MSWINVSIQTVKSHAYDPDGFLSWKFPIDEASTYLKDVKCSYSPCHYNKDSKYSDKNGNEKDGYFRRNDNNAIYGTVNALMLDFDDGLTIDEAKSIFAQYEGVIATTKSHQKDKNGIVCDRFRVIIPMQEAVTLTKEEYSEMMSYVMELYPQADKACKNISRFYFSNPDAEIYLLDGTKTFDWKAVYSKAKKLQAIAKQREANASKAKQTQASSKQREATIIFDGEKIDYLRSIAQTPKFLELIKFDRFSQGGRNNYLYSVAMYLQGCGMSDSEIVDNVLWVNAQGDGIPEKEINGTIFRSMRLGVA